MKLPNANKAYVSSEKITLYLLNRFNRAAAGKVAFFESFGFSIERKDIFENALIRHCRDNTVIMSNSNEYGVKYSVDGELVTPDGRNPLVRTVWIIEEQKAAPRLITAHPLERRKT